MTSTCTPGRRSQNYFRGLNEEGSTFLLTDVDVPATWPRRGRVHVQYVEAFSRLEWIPRCLNRQTISFIPPRPILFSQPTHTVRRANTPGWAAATTRCQVIGRVHDESLMDDCPPEARRRSGSGSSSSPPAARAARRPTAAPSSSPTEEGLYP